MGSFVYIPIPNACRGNNKVRNKCNSLFEILANEILVRGGVGQCVGFEYKLFNIYDPIKSFINFEINIFIGFEIPLQRAVLRGLFYTVGE